jgi:hypothetical protein
MLESKASKKSLFEQIEVYKLNRAPIITVRRFLYKNSKIITMVDLVHRSGIFKALLVLNSLPYCSIFHSIYPKKVYFAVSDFQTFNNMNNGCLFSILFVSFM